MSQSEPVTTLNQSHKCVHIETQKQIQNNLWTHSPEHEISNSNTLLELHSYGCQCASEDDQ